MTDQAPQSIRPLSTRLAQNIAARRRTLGLTQAQLAERLEVDTETLSRFERGKHLPSLQTLERLANSLFVTVAELLDEAPAFTDPETAAAMSWLAPLPVRDKRFALEQLRQTCLHLANRTGD